MVKVWFVLALFCSLAVFLTEAFQRPYCVTCSLNPFNPWLQLNEKLDKIIKLIESKNCSQQAGKAMSSPASTCKEIHDQNLSKGNKAYMLEIESGKIPVYCHMTELGACGGGGWTLVMKIDGTKKTFHYDSKLWSSMNEFNSPGGKTGFDDKETKLPTYWKTPFSKICLGMKIGQQPVRYIAINKQASSLHSLIADGQYRATSLGRNTWKKLIGPLSSSSLQPHCNREGFNSEVTSPGKKIFSRARIGILGNNENNCASCDSRIGFGTGGSPDDSNTCGNVAKYGGDNGDKYIKAMGYVLVQ